MSIKTIGENVLQQREIDSEPEDPCLFCQKAETEQCPHLGEIAVEPFKCTDYVQINKDWLREKAKQTPDPDKIEENQLTKCGDCAYYKTPKCLFQDQEGYIKKPDVGCSDFYFDRHLISKQSLKRKKRKIVLRPHGKR